MEHAYCALNKLCHLNIYNSERDLQRRKKLRLKETK